MFTQEPSPPQPSAGRLFTGNGTLCARFARFTRVFPVISPEVAAQGGVSPAPSPAPTITDQPSAASPAEESFHTASPAEESFHTASPAEESFHTASPAEESFQTASPAEESFQTVQTAANAQVLAEVLRGVHPGTGAAHRPRPGMAQRG
jgi:hypothetical protein